MIFLCLALISCRAPVALLSAIAVHEGGHLLSAYFLGLGFPTVSFSVAGVRLSYSGTHTSGRLWAVCLSGSIAGAILGAFPFFCTEFRLYSIGLSLVNLLPIADLDGGGALLAILESRMLPDRAYVWFHRISVFFALLLCFFSLGIQLKLGANPTLLAVSVYVTVSALTKNQ